MAVAEVAEGSEAAHSQLVVIGASAGGVEALSTLVAMLPRDLAAPVVIAQHLDPRRESRLPEILGRRSTLPVRSVSDSERLEPGTIYMVTSNHDIEITDHEIRAAPPSSAAKPSVDRLLATAAAAYGDQLIAVVLTGSGSDGADGARHVKAAGGTVVIQEPGTASFPSMPQSLAPTTVDIVAPLEAIGPLLGELVRAVGADPGSPEDRLFDTFLRQIRDRTGIDFRRYKPATIRRRIQRRVLATGTTDLRGYMSHANQDPEEFRRLANSFLINVTEFFRDPRTFDHIRQDVLPRLIAEAREQSGELRIWSAGCSTGEEVYSLAMLVLDALREGADAPSVRIFATDVDADALLFARRGIYPDGAVRTVPRALRAKYLAPAPGGGVEVGREVRAITVFGEHDLGTRAPFPRMDLVLCRNVLIYFTPELQRRALQLFAFALREGGTLVLGKAETPATLPQAFVEEDRRLRIYRRNGERVLVTPGPISVARRVDALAPSGEANRTQRAAQAAGPPPQERAAPDEAAAVLRDIPIGVVVIDRNYDIISINATARDLLAIRHTAVGADLLHLVRVVPQDPLRAVIDGALGGEMGSALLQASPSAISDGASPRFLRVTCVPHHLAVGIRPGPAVVLTVTDETTLERQRLSLVDAVSRGGEERDRFAPQLNELAAANRALLEANQELAAANLEQRIANEDLLVSSEEAQAASEEVETLNEELQATNEELETLNEEIQATNEELHTTNEDLEARTLELQALASTLEQERLAAGAERDRLAATLITLADAVVVVDAGGHVVAANRAFETLLVEGHALAPEDEAGQPLAGTLDPMARAARGEAFTMQFGRSLPDGSHRWYEARGEPIGSSGSGAGGVVIIRDITDRSLRQLEEQFMAVASHELRTPLAALNGYLQVIERLEPVREHEPTRRFVSGALIQARRLSQLLAQLLDVTRLRSGKLVLDLAPVDLGQVVRDAVDTIRAAEPSRRINLTAPSSRIPLTADAGRLEQVLLNVIGNAVTFAPDGDIDVRVIRRRATAVVEVQDQGPGIAAEDLPLVFSRFYQATKPTPRAGGEGLGLGLFIARELIVAHGGTITASSVLGSGATFSMELPIAVRGRRSALVDDVPAGA